MGDMGGCPKCYLLTKENDGKDSLSKATPVSLEYCYDIQLSVMDT
jgi:hypothetical protein